MWAVGDLTRDTLARLRALHEAAEIGELTAVSVGESGDDFGIESKRWTLWDDNNTVRDEEAELIAEAVNALPALLAAAERDLDRREGLVFGPQHDGRHAVAVDGVHYWVLYLEGGWVFEADDRIPEQPNGMTEAEAIEQARAHDAARRGGR